MGGVESGEASRHNGTNSSDEKGSVRTENQNQIEASDVAKIVVGTAALAGLAYGAYCAFSGSGSDSVSDKKTMKAPGKKGQVMYRDDFENDPTKYFRALRNKD